MGDMIDAAAQRPLIGPVDNVEGQRRVDRQVRVQAAGSFQAL